MSIPRDFVAEVERELQLARLRLRGETARWSALEELYERALSVSLLLRRPVTVFDVFAAAGDEAERRHLTRLVEELRSRDSAG